jgi:hypothetical protein
MTKLQPGDPDYRPARGYSWEQFKPGHTLSIRHGAYSTRRINPIAEALAEDLLALAAIDGSPVQYLASQAWLATVHAWADAEARAQLIREYLDEVGMWDAKGEPRKVMPDLHKFERRAADLRGRLGLDPLSRARLGRDVTSAEVDLAMLWAALQPEADGTPGDPPPPGPLPPGGDVGGAT